MHLFSRFQVISPAMPHLGCGIVANTLLRIHVHALSISSRSLSQGNNNPMSVPD